MESALRRLADLGPVKGSDCVKVRTFFTGKNDRCVLSPTLKEEALPGFVWVSLLPRSSASSVFVVFSPCKGGAWARGTVGDSRGGDAVGALEDGARGPILDSDG